jgi:DNA topoisomerase I
MRHACKPRMAKHANQAARGAEPGVPAECSAAGLHWTCDAQAGIRRCRRGQGFAYLDAAGRPLRDADALERIRRLAIPPAWRQVWICADATGHLQATGRDARGRKQYRYHARWQAERGQTKFDQLLVFGEVLPRIRERVQRALAGAAEPTRSRVLATLVRLLDTTWLRIGNPEYARSNETYGLSTLHTRHAGVRGQALTLSFVGKSGVRHQVCLADPQIARVVRRCRDLPGQELFQYVDRDGAVHRIGSADVNAWLTELAGQRITAKDFRTWHGSVQALALIVAACEPGSAPSRVQEVIATVAGRLGNTPAVCRKAYIHPAVLDLAGALGDAGASARLLRRAWVRRAPALRRLSLHERRLVGLLREARRGANAPIGPNARARPRR